MVAKIASICAILFEGVSRYLKGVNSKCMYNVSHGKTVNSDKLCKEKKHYFNVWELGELIIMI